MQKWVGLGRLQSFMLFWVGLGHFTCGSRWVGSKNGPTSNLCHQHQIYAGTELKELKRIELKVDRLSSMEQNAASNLFHHVHDPQTTKLRWSVEVTVVKNVFYVFLKFSMKHVFKKCFFFKFYVCFFISKTFIILTWPKEPQDKCLFVNLFFSLDSEWTNKVKAYARKQCLFCFILAHGYLLSLSI